MSVGTGTVLHVSPHPDDELIGAPAALLALRDAGWRVVNLACSLGAPDERERRLAELRAACDAVGFTLETIPDPPGSLLAASTTAGADDVLRAAVSAALARHSPDLVVAPSPHDRHPGHEVVGRAALGALDGARPAPRLWLWGVWADLPFPSVAVGFDDDRLEEILGALSAHGGELARNDYRRLVHGRAEMNASLGPERVFGFGSAATGSDYVELVCELVPGEDGAWLLGSPHWLDAADALAPGHRVPLVDLTSWLRAPSLTSRFGRPGIGT